MPHVLHVIEYLDKGGATRAALATAKESAKFGSYEHSFVSLKPAHPEAVELARAAGIQTHQTPSISQLDGLIDEADIVQVEYWNAPAVNHLLHSTLPPHRLAIWFHVAGNTAPQLIHETLFNFADVPIACNPTTFEEHPLFQQARHVETSTSCPRAARVTAPADFDRIKHISPKAHEGFQVGYIGTLNFAKMHRDFIPMSAHIEIPDVKFIVCGEGIEEELKRQAESLNAADRFEFKGFVEDIGSVIETLDVYGYPLCEDTYAGSELNLQEVMYAGIPPVVFPHGGIKGLVQHNRTGLFVTSAEDYRRAIEYLYYNPVERRRLGVNAAAHARAHFGAKNAARTINKVYKQLLSLPKRYHAWGEEAQPFAPRLSDKTPTDRPTSDVFIESLGEHGAAFRTSKYETDIESQLAADRDVAASSYLVFHTGIYRYTLHAPNDPHLRLWAGLYLEEHGMHAEAVSSYAAAIAANLSDWRVQWYLARTLKKQGKAEEARRVYSSLRNNVRRFEELTGDTSYASSHTETISFSTRHPEDMAVATPETDAGPTAEQPSEEQNDIRLSALVSTYSAEAFMEGCLNDLVDQTLFQKGEMEIIVIDACSPENEKAIVERFQALHDRIVYVRTDRRETLYASWNRAINRARGRYVTSANTDDRHRHDALEILADYLDAHPHIALTYPGQIDTSVPNETFDTTSSGKILDWPAYSYDELERHCIIGSQPVWRRSLHDTYGYFRDTFKSAGDYEFWLRIGKQETFYRHPEILGLYYRNPRGIEHGSNTSKEETLRIWKEYGMFERGIPVILEGRLVAAPPASTKTPAPLPRQPFEAYITDFERALLDRNLDRALAIADSSLAHYSDLPYAHILRAIALRQLDRHAEALEMLETSIHIQETPEALVELIQLSLTTDNNDEAAKTEAYIRQQYPEWAEKLAHLEQQHSDSEASDGTIPADMSRPAGLDDLDYTVQSFDELKREFEQRVRMRDVNQAERLAQAATRTFPDNSESWVLKATSHRLNGSFHEAREAIHRSLLIKDSPEALIELLELSLSTGDVDEALNIAEMVQESYPSFRGYITELLNGRLEKDGPENDRLEQPAREPLAFNAALQHFMPISPDKIDGFRSDDYGLVSFPGSGSARLATLVADILQQCAGYSTSPGHMPAAPEVVIPNLHVQAITPNWLEEHGFQGRIFQAFDIAGTARQPMIYVFRDPIEALISAYHYYRQDESLRARANMSCDAFCTAQIENYNLHLNAALSMREKAPSKVLLVDHKHFSIQPVSTLQRVLDRLGVQANPPIIERALTNQDLDPKKSRPDAASMIDLSDIDLLQLGMEGTDISQVTIESIIARLMPVYQEATRHAVLQGEEHLHPVDSFQ